MPTPRDHQLLASIRAGDRSALHVLGEMIRESIRELEIPGLADARGRLDHVVTPLQARLVQRFRATEFELRGSLQAFVMTFVALRRDELQPGLPPTGRTRLDEADPEHLADAVLSALHKLTHSHSPDVRELAETWLALAEEGASLDVHSGNETARMLKTASPLLARKSDGEFANALRAFRTTLGFELGKLGF